MTSCPNDISFVKQESNNYSKEVLLPAENGKDSNTDQYNNKTQTDTKPQLQNINITDTQISLMDEDKTAKLINTKLLPVSPYLGYKISQAC